MIEWGLGSTEQQVDALVRRVIPFDSIPDYVLGTDERHTTSGGILAPVRARQEWIDSQRRLSNYSQSRWVSVLRRQETQRLQAEQDAEALRNPPEPVMFPESYWERQARPDPPEFRDGDDIPF